TRRLLLRALRECWGLRNGVCLIHSLSPEGELGDKFGVVVNRDGLVLGDEDGITVKKAEEVIGKPIFWQIPNDPKPMIGCRVAGQPLIQFAPKSKAQQSVQGLAHALTGKAPTAAPEKKKGWFSS